MFTGFVRDITERKRAEDEIRQLNADLEKRVRTRTAELEALNGELEAFSYSVSHDLRAPLRHVNGFADLLQRYAREKLDEKGQRYLEHISDSARKMGELIDDLLMFSRMGRLEMGATAVDLNALVRETRDALVSEAPERVIEWHLSPLPEVQGDVAMLRLVFVNLMSNAVKYTARRARAEIAIDAMETDDETVLRVRDNGVGFDMTYAAKLFGVFQRLHSAEDFEGTGIGLANVRRIIQRHGGRTWAEGMVDVGATFCFALPRTVRTEAGHRKEAA
jgi:light-regulated signal transduction histidine kinase (bacteriophytochrome)